MQGTTINGVARLVRPASVVLPPTASSAFPGMLAPVVPALPGPMIPTAVPKKRTSYSKSRKRSIFFTLHSEYHFLPYIPHNSPHNILSTIRHNINLIIYTKNIHVVHNKILSWYFLCLLTSRASLVSLHLVHCPSSRPRGTSLRPAIALFLACPF